MSRFLTTLDTRLIDEFDGINLLLAPLVYESDLLGQTVTVPKDFRTDYASVPRLPLAYLAVGGKGTRAAVVHDWLYSGGLGVTRETADAVFKEALLASGYSGFTAALMYAGVRFGGESRFTQPNVPQAPHVAAMMEVA